MVFSVVRIVRDQIDERRCAALEGIHCCDEGRPGSTNEGPRINWEIVSTDIKSSIIFLLVRATLRERGVLTISE